MLGKATENASLSRRASAGIRAEATPAAKSGTSIGTPGSSSVQREVKTSSRRTEPTRRSDDHSSPDAAPPPARASGFNHARERTCRSSAAGLALPSSRSSGTSTPRAALKSPAMRTSTAEVTPSAAKLPRGSSTHRGARAAKHLETAGRRSGRGLGAAASSASQSRHDVSRVV